MDSTAGFEPANRGSIPREGTNKNLASIGEIFIGYATILANFLKAMIFEVRDIVVGFVVDIVVGFVVEILAGIVVAFFGYLPEMDRSFQLAEEVVDIFRRLLGNRRLAARRQNWRIPPDFLHNRLGILPEIGSRLGRQEIRRRLVHRRPEDQNHLLLH